jgi:Transposase DDE domain
MHAAASVLQKCLPVVMGSMHAVRARALLNAVDSLLRSRRLILMDMARAWPGAERVRAPLKCLDRLLSNSHLHAQRERFYAATMAWVIRQSMPIILVDWSDLHEDCRWQLLRAAVPVEGRSITILDMVFPESMKGSPIAERQLLQRLRALLPRSITPIFVTDAGFRAPWFRSVARFGWHYIGRLRHRTLLRIQDGEWFDNRRLLPQATARPRRFESVTMVANDPWHADLVLYKKPSAGRVRLNRHGTRSRSHTSLKSERRERAPWLLVASCALSSLSARQIVSIYRKRMQIEQSFRDLKCDRFGCAFYYSLTRKPERIAMLLLIHALATFVAWLAALSQTTTIALRQYGGVLSARARPHYSLLRVGWEAVRRNDPASNPVTLRAAFIHPPSSFLNALRLPV